MIRMQRGNKALATVIVVLASLWLSACATRSSGSFSGRVVEAGSQSPIADAVVVATWTGKIGIAHQQTSCVHLMTTTTNVNGEYYFPRWRKAIRTRPSRLSRRVYAYKQSYKYSGDLYSEERPILLQPFTGTRQEHLEHVSGVVWEASCGDKENRRNELPVLYKRLYQEALELAGYNESNEALKDMRGHMVIPWNPTTKSLLPNETEKVFDEFVRPILND